MMPSGSGCAAGAGAPVAGDGGAAPEEAAGGAAEAADSGPGGARDAGRGREECIGKLAAVVGGCCLTCAVSIVCEFVSAAIMEFWRGHVGDSSTQQVRRSGP